MDTTKPTALQLQLAKKLDIDLSGMTKAKLSSLFKKMLDPAFDDNEGDVYEAIANAIDEIDPGDVFALTLYQRGKKYIVDVLRFEGLTFDDKNRIYIECTVPVLDRTDAPDFYIPMWDDKIIEVTIDKILFFRVLPDDFEDRCQFNCSMDYYLQTIAWAISKNKELGIEAEVNPIAKPSEPRGGKQAAQKQRLVEPPPRVSGCGCLVLLVLVVSLAVLGATAIA